MSKIDLENKIKHYASLYYAGNPEISDDEFDDLVDQLREIDPNSYVLTTVGWGSGVETNGKKTDHKYQLIGSLNKIKNVDDIPNYRFPVVSAKLDGLSAVLYYKNGKLEKAVTRGNGTQGIDITEKVVRILDGKTTIEPKLTCAIRGELVISVDDWNSMIEVDSSLKNPRNTAAGIINRNEITDDIDYVSLVVYNVIGMEDAALDTYNQEGLYNLLNNNFATVCPHEFGINRKLSEIYEDYKKLYPCDGLVIGNQMVEHQSNDAMKYDQIAFKFPAEKRVTTVKKIEWTISRTGKLIPVLVVAPVELSGATVTRCTAFNAKYVHDLGITSGTTVEMMRSNEVIPTVTKVIDGTVDGGSIPTVCPECGNPVAWNGVDVVCDNPDCVSKDYYDLIVWVNNIGKVDNIGSTLKIKFMDELRIRNISDIYNKNHVFNKAGTQRDLFRKVLSKLITEEVDAVDALCALNIPRLGRTTATKLAGDKDLLEEVFNDMITGEGSIQRDEDKLSSLLGPATADSIIKNRDKFVRLDYVWDRIKFTKQIDKSQMIKVAVTGKLSVKRAEFEKMLNENGFVLSGVGKDTALLITDDPTSSSSKNKAADKFGIEKISEDNFRERYGL